MYLAPTYTYIKLQTIYLTTILITCTNNNSSENKTAFHGGGVLKFTSNTILLKTVAT